MDTSISDNWGTQHDPIFAATTLITDVLFKQFTIVVECMGLSVNQYYPA